MDKTNNPGDRVARALRRLSADEGGATSIEYGLIAALMAVAIIGSLAALGSANGGSWAATANKASDAMAP